MSNASDAEHEADRQVVVHLLVDLLAQRTEPGQGHLVFSASESDEWLRVALHGRSMPSQSWQALRNQLVHSQIQTSNYDALLESVLKAATERTEHRPGGRQSSIGSMQDSERQEAHELTQPVTDLTNSFVDHLTAHAEDVGKLDPKEARRLGRRAAEEVLAAARWSHVVGDRLDTSQVTTLLGVSRQALANRQRAGSLLGLPGEGTTWYPAWQFDARAAAIRPEVRDIIGAFRDLLGDVDPFVVASWATTPQEEDLDGQTPARWLETGGDSERLRTAASRAAARLAR